MIFFYILVGFRKNNGPNIREIWGFIRGEISGKFRFGCMVFTLNQFIVLFRSRGFQLCFAIYMRFCYSISRLLKPDYSCYTLAFLLGLSYTFAWSVVLVDSSGFVGLGFLCYIAAQAAPRGAPQSAIAAFRPSPCGKRLCPSRSFHRDRKSPDFCRNLRVL